MCDCAGLFCKINCPWACGSAAPINVFVPEAGLPQGIRQFWKTGGSNSLPMWHSFVSKTPWMSDSWGQGQFWLWSPGYYPPPPPPPQETIDRCYTQPTHSTVTCPGTCTATQWLFARFILLGIVSHILIVQACCQLALPWIIQGTLQTCS